MEIITDARPLGPKRLIALIIAYVLIAFVLLGANPFRGETTGPFDLLVSYPGWNPEQVEVKVRNGERSDVVDWLLPAWMESRRQIHEGNLPLWNPLQAGGRAAFLDPSNAQATVGFAVFAATPDPALGFYLAILCTLVVGGLGMHLFVARYCTTWSAFFAGASFMGCGFFAAWLYWPHVQTAVWIPWLLLAVDCFSATRSRKALAAIAMATAVLFLGGFPYVVALGLGAAIVHGFFAMLFGDNRERRMIGYAGIAAGMVLGLSLVALPLLTLASTIDGIDMARRTSGSILRFHDAKLLSLPWAAAGPRVERNMYVGMLALLLAPLGLGLLFRRKGHPLVLTGVVLLAVGAALTFELLPREIGSKLPVLSSSLWTRAILLLNVGILLLAACGVELLTGRWKWRIGAVSLAIILCLVQISDVKQQFRKFNGATPAKYFYPLAPELETLRADARPFQYVAHDFGYFLFSGTTGAVGLGDWFAHALRSPQLQNFLDAMADDPFTSPTATGIPIHSFHMAGSVADGGGLCYVAYGAGNSWGEVVAGSLGQFRKALPPISEVPVTQRFTVARPVQISSATIRLATYRDTGHDGTVTVTLKPVGQGAPFAVAGIPAGSVRDNQMAVFGFPQPVSLAAGDYELTLLYSPGPLGRRMTVWTVAGAEGSVLHGDKPHPGSLSYALVTSEDGSMAELASGPVIGVAKSVRCMDGPYLATDLTRLSATAQPGRAVLLDYRASAFSVEVSAPAAGYLIVPMQYQRGWSAAVNGEPIRMHLAHGVMPAIPVPAGKSKVALDYRPPGLWLGLAVSVPALLLLVWLLFSRRRPNASARLDAVPNPVNRELR